MQSRSMKTFSCFEVSLFGLHSESSEFLIMMPFRRSFMLALNGLPHSSGTEWNAFLSLQIMMSERKFTNSVPMVD